MALRFLERELRRELAGIGREALMRSAVERIGLTDDGGTIYVHLFPKAGSAKAPGRAFVLAWHDYAGDASQRLCLFPLVIAGGESGRRGGGDRRWRAGPSRRARPYLWPWAWPSPRQGA